MMGSSVRGMLKAAPLAAALAGALPAVAAAPRDSQSQRPGVVELHDSIRALMPAVAAVPATPASGTSTRIVTDCGDGGGAQTLRGAVAAAGEGDTIDLTSLACSQVTLTQGAIPVLLDQLTIAGPGSSRLRIDGADADRVFVHPGSGALTLSGVTVQHGAARATGNHVTGGGCIASTGYVVLDHSVVSDCYATAVGAYGGGIYSYGLRMYTSTLTRCAGVGSSPATNTATFGGGAYATTVTLRASTVSGNRATHDPAQGKSSYDTGGGIFTNLGGYVLNSTIDSNYSHGIGGGVSVFGGVLTVVNSTLSGNVANDATGGAIDARVFNGGRIANSTITANRAAFGGGVYLRGLPTVFTLQSSLVAGNDSGGGGADFGSSTAVSIDGANNLIVDANANVALPGATLRADPQLLPLADNGGPTRTHALRPTSPALDAGNNLAALTTDQRGTGFPRQVGAGTDIGAFEGFVAPPPGPASVPLGVGGLGLLAGFVAGIGALAARGSVPFGRFFTRLSPRRGHLSHR